MMLIEETTIPDAALPLEAFKRHLRMGSGFGTGSLQDDVLLGFLRSATAAIEGRLGKALMIRDFAMTLSEWRSKNRQVLPIAPVSAVNEVTLLHENGAETVVDTEKYWLDFAGADPVLLPLGGYMAGIPKRGHARVRFTAGMAADAEGLPADLRQAVLMLAAHYYEFRNDTGLGEGCMPFGVTSLIQRYRPIRLGVAL